MWSAASLLPSDIGLRLGVNCCITSTTGKELPSVQFSTAEDHSASWLRTFRAMDRPVDTRKSNWQSPPGERITPLSEAPSSNTSHTARLTTSWTALLQRSGQLAKARARRHPRKSTTLYGHASSCAQRNWSRCHTTCSDICQGFELCGGRHGGQAGPIASHASKCELIAN